MSLPVCPPVRLAIWLRRWAIVGVLCGGKWKRSEINARRNDAGIRNIGSSRNVFSGIDASLIE